MHNYWRFSDFIVILCHVLHIFTRIGSQSKFVNNLHDIILIRDILYYFSLSHLLFVNLFITIQLSVERKCLIVDEITVTGIVYIPAYMQIA